MADSGNEVLSYERLQIKASMKYLLQRSCLAGSTRRRSFVLSAALVEREARIAGYSAAQQPTSAPGRWPRSVQDRLEHAVQQCRQSVPTRIRQDPPSGMAIRLVCRFAQDGEQQEGVAPRASRTPNSGVRRAMRKG